jgi:hypothetical protein
MFTHINFTSPRSGDALVIVIRRVPEGGLVNRKIKIGQESPAYTHKSRR